LFYLLIVLFLTTFFFLYLNKKTGKIITILPDSEDDEDFIELPDEKAYFDETNLAIIELKKKIDKSGIGNDDIEEINKLKNSISANFNQWEMVQKELDKMIKERTEFVNEAKFYPTEYVYDINRMYTEKEKARDFQLNNPLRSLAPIKIFIQEQNEKVGQYKEIKEKVELMLAKLEIYEKDLTKKELVPYFKKKQELFIHLQNGNLKDAKKLLKHFRGKVKDI
jgi:hypothetical protein